MIKVTDLYDITKLPVDEHLIDKLISKYLKISHKDMCNEMRETDSLLYDEINYCTKNKKNKFNEEDKAKFLKELNEDYSKSGKLYYHEGIASNPIARMPGWATFQSWYLLGTPKIESNDISHRFYFGISNEKLYELSNVLYDKFKKANIPFYFKAEMNTGLQRTDNVILYTSTPLLEKTMNVIEEVIKERKDLIDECNEPSILTGKIYGKVGYASEDINTKKSYTESVCESFVKSLDSTIYQYKLRNPNSKYKSDYKQKIREYIDSNKQVDLNRIRNRILLNLIKEDPGFKDLLLLDFKNELMKKGFDTNNICFNKRVKREVNSYYINQKSKTRDELIKLRGSLAEEEQNRENNKTMKNSYGFASIIVISLVAMLIALYIFLTKMYIQ